MRTSAQRASSAPRRQAGAVRFGFDSDRGPQAAWPGAGRAEVRLDDPTTMQYRVLGPVTVEAGNGPVPLGGPKQRLVLALLLVEPDRVVHVERLIDGVWEEDPPSGAAHGIQAYVSELRRVLPDPVTFESGGYRLQVDPARIDSRRFEVLVEAGRKATEEDPDTAATTLREALALWRGEPYADLRYAEALQTEIDRLEAMRISTLEYRVEAELALGRPAADSRRTRRSLGGARRAAARTRWPGSRARRPTEGPPPTRRR